jgi:hypothetical protein
MQNCLVVILTQTMKNSVSLKVELHYFLICDRFIANNSK